MDPLDMKVDSQRIKAEREQRAWSQEHLAQAAGLGLRTIQRIEKTGVASFESARALAAVFALDLAELRVADAPVRVRRFGWRPSLGAAAALLTVGALFIATTGFADQVLLDVGISLNEAGALREWKTQMVVDEGTLVPNVNDLRLEELRFEIVPTFVARGRILLVVRIFERRGNDDILLSEPRLVTPDGEEAQIKLETEAGRSVGILITPRRTPPLAHLNIWR